MEKCTIFYIGGESLGLTNLLMTHSSCEVRLHPSIHSILSLINLNLLNLQDLLI